MRICKLELVNNVFRIQLELQELLATTKELKKKKCFLIKNI